MAGGGSSTLDARGRVDFSSQRYILDIANTIERAVIMSASRAVVPTASASRYLQQLCKHWAHKFEVSFDAHQGRIALPFGPVTLHASDVALEVTCTIAGDGDLARMQQVTAEHLNRFAHREGELVFDWQPLP